MTTTSLDEDISSKRVMRWALRILVFACTTILVGIIWDISWHMTIGRDTFWTPAHLAMYLGGASSGVLAGVLAIRTTFFAGPEEKKASLEILKGRAPLGVWIVIWGAVAMITSAPFDDWWHNAYGLDVKIISPPHVLLFTGVLSIVVGTLLLALREQNNLGNDRSAQIIFPYVGGVVINFLSILFFSNGWPNNQHSSYYYYICCIIYPVILVAVARASRRPWAATLSAISYMAVTIAMLWILPRFSAHPKLGPVLNPVTHMVPPYFPHLLIAPALLIDWLKQRGALDLNWKQNWLIAGVVGVGFALVFGIVQYFFAIFLLSSAAHNAIFVGGQSAPYYSAHVDRSEVFWGDNDLGYLPHLAKVLIASVLSARAGLMIGNWMKKVHR